MVNNLRGVPWRISYKKISLALFFVLILFFSFYFNLHKYFTLKNLKANKEYLRFLVKNNYSLSLILFILAYIFVSTFSIPGALVLTLSGGFLFGLAGVIYSATSATVGACFAFLIVRNLIGEYVQSKYSEKLKQFNYEFKTYGFFYLLALRLVPIFPFFLINILAALTSVSLFIFFTSTFLGIIPGVFIYTYIGRKLSEIQTISDVFSSEILLGFVLLAIFALLPVIYKKYFSNLILR